MSFTVVIEGMTLIAYLVVLAGGKQKRESGWKILSTLLLLAGVVQCAGMALIVSRDPRRYSPLFVGLGVRLLNGAARVRLGLSVRLRRSILSALAAGYFVDAVYGELVPYGDFGHRHCRGRFRVAGGRRLRTYTRGTEHVPGPGRLMSFENFKGIVFSGTISSCAGSQSEYFVRVQG